MAYVGYLRYVLQGTPALLVRDCRLGSATACAIVPSFALYHLALALRYSYFFRQATLLDLGGYDVPRASPTPGYAPVLWHLFKDAAGRRYFIFSAQTASPTPVQSIELLFRNARWLEREASEFFGFFFSSKLDRRTLFTIPLFYAAPLRRRYPAVGFYEIFFCPLLKKLKFKHLSLQV